MKFKVSTGNRPFFYYKCNRKNNKKFERLKFPEFFYNIFFFGHEQNAHTSKENTLAHPQK